MAASSLHLGHTGAGRAWDPDQRGRGRVACPGVPLTAGARSARRPDRADRIDPGISGADHRLATWSRGVRAGVADCAVRHGDLRQALRRLSTAGGGGDTGAALGLLRDSSPDATPGTAALSLGQCGSPAHLEHLRFRHPSPCRRRTGRLQRGPAHHCRVAALVGRPPWAAAVAPRCHRRATDSYPAHQLYSTTARAGEEPARRP